MTDKPDLRSPDRPDRRASSRGGRRAYDPKKPWWRRRRLWLAVASMAVVGWRRFRHKEAA